MGTMQGRRLLAEINIIRAIQGLEPLGEIGVDNGPCSCMQCSVARAGACGIDAVSHPDWGRTWALRFADGETARGVADALRAPYDSDRRLVRASDVLDSLFIASSFGLTWVSPDGLIVGWIDPSDRDPRLWELHLMPGRSYPPGHEPHGHDGAP